MAKRDPGTWIRFSPEERAAPEKALEKAASIDGRSLSAYARKVLTEHMRKLDVLKAPPPVTKLVGKARR
jgi:hypothetical protein